jgi:hypothetical protein
MVLVTSTQDLWRMQQSYSMISWRAGAFLQPVDPRELEDATIAKSSDIINAMHVIQNASNDSPSLTSTEYNYARAHILCRGDPFRQCPKDF